MKIKKGRREKRGGGERGGGMSLTDILKDENDEERRDQVIDALHVAAGRMPDGPDKQDPLKNLNTYKYTRRQKVKIFAMT